MTIPRLKVYTFYKCIYITLTLLNLHTIDNITRLLIFTRKRYLGKNTEEMFGVLKWKLSIFFFFFVLIVKYLNYVFFYNFSQHVLMFNFNF